MRIGEIFTKKIQKLKFDENVFLFLKLKLKVCVAIVENNTYTEIFVT